jgi:enoyl-CoA hydratase/carnithine racemase
MGLVFLQQAPPPPPQRLLTLARAFYERAVKAQQAKKMEIANEYLAAADDLTHALESLAQSALP